MKIKNNKIGFLLILLFLISCGNVKKVYKDKYGSSLPSQSIKKLLDYYKAHDSIYSILIFTSVYENNTYIVKNGNNTVFDDKLNSDPVSGLAHAVRIDNRYNVSITEKYRDFTFTLKSRNLKKYKYIYISRDKWSKHPSFKVIFSNTLVGFQ